MAVSTVSEDGSHTLVVSDHLEPVNGAFLRTQLARNSLVRHIRITGTSVTDVTAGDVENIESLTIEGSSSNQFDHSSGNVVINGSTFSGNVVVGKVTGDVTYNGVPEGAYSTGPIGGPSDSLVAENLNIPNVSMVASGLARFSKINGGQIVEVKDCKLVENIAAANQLDISKCSKVVDPNAPYLRIERCTEVLGAPRHAQLTDCTVVGPSPNSSSASPTPPPPGSQPRRG